MDWSLGRTALLAAHAAILDTRNPSDDFRSALRALAYTESDPIYIVDGRLVKQLSFGTCQTGSSWTTWLDNLPRKYDINCRFGVKVSGKAFLPVKNYEPFLAERDVASDDLSAVGWCGRHWNEKGEYRLDKSTGFWPKSQAITTKQSRNARLLVRRRVLRS